jgi:hypothetical protein
MGTIQIVAFPTVPSGQYVGRKHPSSFFPSRQGRNVNRVMK